MFILHILKDVILTIFKSIGLIVIGIFQGYALEVTYMANTDQRKIKDYKTLATRLVINTFTCYIIASLYIAMEDRFTKRHEAIWLLSVYVSVVFLMQPSLFESISPLIYGVVPLAAPAGGGKN